MTLRVFLADDHRLLVEGFRHALKDMNVDVVEVAYSLDGLVDRYFEIKPDVLVIDVRFENRSNAPTGLDACKEILARDSSARIVVLSQFDDPYLIESTYKMGVLAFVRKDENPEVLFKAISTVARGEEFFSPAGAQLLALSAVRDKNPAKHLDAKELEVFRLTADGKSIMEIAAEISMSTKTVGNMLRSIKSALGIENQAEFTKLGVRYGLTDLDLRKKS